MGGSSDVDVLAAVLDPARLATLRQLDLLDTLPEESFDRLTRLASRLLRAPVALVSLVDAERQFFKSAVGLPEPWASARQTPLSHSFCKYLVASGHSLTVTDARLDPVLSSNLAIDELGVIAYAGVPLKVRGDIAGSFCVIDDKPRVWTPEELEVLADLGAEVVSEVELRVALRELEASHRTTEVARSRLAAVLDATDDGMAALTASGHVSVANKRFKQMFGASEAGTQLRDGTIDDVVALVSRGLGTDEAEAWLGLSSDGHAAGIHARQSWPKSRELQLYSLPVHSNDDAEFGRLLVARDVTREREVDRMKSEFISIVSHEFRTPLTGITGFSEMIRDEELDIDTVREYADDINQDAKRLTRLVNDMLSLERLESGKTQLALGPVHLDQVVQRVVDLARKVDPGRAFALDLSAPSAVTADEDRFVRVVTNLVGNAIKFSPPSGAVSIRTGQDREWAWVSVSDEGIGIAEEDLNRIFDRYSRIDSGRHKGIPGTGLGLPIARQIARLHGGDLTVDSSPGNGSTFRLRIPSQANSS